MHFSLNIVHVFAVVSSLGCVLGNGEGGDLGSQSAVDGASSGTGAKGCPMAKENDRSFYSILQDGAEECIKISDLENLNTTEQIRSAYTSYCNELPARTQCLARLKLNAKLCMDEFLQTRFKLYCDFKELTVQVTCSHNLERTIAIREAANQQRAFSPGTDNLMDKCYVDASSIGWVFAEDDPNVDMVYQYRTLQIAKECLAKHQSEGQDTLVNGGLALWTELMYKINCVNPYNRFQVLCKRLILD